MIGAMLDQAGTQEFNISGQGCAGQWVLAGYSTSTVKRVASLRVFIGLSMR